MKNPESDEDERIYSEVELGSCSKATELEEIDETSVSQASSSRVGSVRSPTCSIKSQKMGTASSPESEKNSLDFSIDLSSSSETQSNNGKIDWNSLPYGIILEIFSYLEEKDRTLLAQTCKRFYAAFLSPVLWRRKRVLFGGLRSTETAARSCVFVNNFGKYIKYLEIECGHPTLHSARPMAVAVEMFLNHLSRVRGTKILSFKIDYMDFYHGWRFFELSRARLIGALCKFIRKQRHLQFIDVSGAQIDTRDGSRILKAVGACHARNTLQTLHLKDFFELRYIAPNNQSFMSALKRFSALKEIYLNFIYLSGSVLEILGRRLGPCLERIRTVIDSSESQIRTISSYDWLALREHCPNLKVVFHFLGILSQSEYISALCRCIPLIEVDILSWEGYPNDLEPDSERMSEVLMHIANNFYNEVVRFRISIDHTSDDPLDNAMIFLLEKCNRMKEFTVNANLSLSTVESICEMAAKRKPSILDHLELRVRGLSPGDTSRLTQITQTYMNQISRRQLEVRSDSN